MKNISDKDSSWLKGSMSSVQFFVAKAIFCKFYKYLEWILNSVLNLKCQHLLLPWARKGRVDEWKFCIQNLVLMNYKLMHKSVDMKQDSPLKLKLSPILCYSGYLTLHFDLEQAFHHLTEKFISWRDLDWILWKE